MDYILQFTDVKKTFHDVLIKINVPDESLNLEEDKLRDEILLYYQSNSNLIVKNVHGLTDGLWFLKNVTRIDNIESVDYGSFEVQK